MEDREIVRNGQINLETASLSIPTIGKPRTRWVVRWEFLLPVIVLGLLLTGASLWTSIALNWRGILPQFLLEFGGTILLGSGLYFVQRHFLKEVDRETRKVVEQINVKTIALENEIVSQSTRIDTLTEEVDAYRRSRHDEEDKIVRAVTDEISFKVVNDALSDAKSHDLTSNEFRVRCSEDLAGMRLRLESVYRMRDNENKDPMIGLNPWFPDERYLEFEVWDQDENVAVVMDRLIEKLEKAKMDSSKSILDPQLIFKNLRTSLEVARNSVRGNSERRLEGALIELVDDDWALTDVGLESLTRGVVIPIDEFPQVIPMFPNLGSVPSFPPPAPEGVSEDFWNILMTIAAKSYRVRKRGAGRKGF